MGVACVASAESSTALMETNNIDNTYLGKALKFVGLTKDHDKINVESPTKNTPKVQAFGWDSTLDTDVNDALYSSDGNWGMDIGVNIDIGAYYELPVYNQNNYLVFRQRLGVYAGGR